MTVHLGRKLRKVRRQSELDAVLDAGEIPLLSGHGLFVVTGEALVYATSGMVDACGCARVVARAHAAVRAQAAAHVWSEDRVHVDAYDRATVVASGGSCVRAVGESRVFAEERALITVLDKAEAVCRDTVTAHADGLACVHASGQVRVFADGEAVVRAVTAASVCVSVHRDREVDGGTHGIRQAHRAGDARQEAEFAWLLKLVQAEPGRSSLVRSDGARAQRRA